jgi:type II secretory pathway component PulM
VIGTLSRRERAIVVAGVAAVLVVLVWQFAVEPLLQRSRDLAELVPAREALLVRGQDKVARKAAITAELEAVTARLDKVGERFLPAGTPAVAASELQKTIKELASQAATEVRSERILPPIERGELLEVPIEVTVSGEIRQLVDLLHRLDTTPKLLSVQDVKIRVVNVSQPKDLLATLTLSGFILPAKGKA